MKVVYDTCLYIDLLRSSAHLDLFRDRTHIRYFSPVVLMELFAGARTPAQRKIVEKLVQPYSQANRLIHLGARAYYKAGLALAKLGQNTKSLSRGFSHDLLIALSAHAIGATLFTRNRDDFTLIAKIIPVKLHFIELLH